MTRPTFARRLSGTNGPRARATLALALAGGLATALGAGGCDRKDPAEKAISGASRTLGAVASATSAPGAAPKYLEPALGAVRKDAKDLGSNPSASDTASAGLLSARAIGGIAGLKAAEAADLQAQARLLSLAVYDSLDTYMQQASAATGVEQFDPAPELKRLADDVSAKEQEISKAAGVKRQLQDEAAKLESDAQAALTAAQAERTGEAQIRRQAQDASGQGRTDLITQANQRRRAADGHDKKAADLRAQLAVLTPRIEGADRELAALTGQRKLLQDAVAEIQALAQNAKLWATESRAAAATTAETIRADLAKLDEMRAKIEAPAKAATDGYASAAAEARKAGQGATRDGKSATTLAAAGFQADGASVFAALADSHRAYAALLEGLAAAQPPLPGADKYASAAAEARKAETEARTAANKLFGQAKEAMAGAGGGEDVKAANERISAALDALSKGESIPASGSLLLGAGPSEGAAPATRKNAPAPAAPSAPGAEGEIRAMLGSLEEILQSGDIARIEKTIILPDGPVKDLLRAQVDVDKAIREKFSISADEATKQAGLPGAAEQLSAMGLPGLSAIAVKVAGPDAGTISFPIMGQNVTVPVKKSGGAWALDLAGSQELKGMFGMMGGMFAPMTTQMKQFAADIRAGKYPDAVSAMRAMEEAAKRGPGGG
jgi:hypothetical protein